jgi:hypothetical protein
LAIPSSFLGAYVVGASFRLSGRPSGDVELIATGSA